MSLLDTLHAEHKARRERLFRGPAPRPVPALEAPKANLERKPLVILSIEEERKPLVILSIEELDGPSDKRGGYSEIMAVLNEVAAFYGYRPRDLEGDQRTASIVRARQVGMYLARAITFRSLTAIGRRFGRDHSTVIHSVNKIAEFRKTDARLNEEIETLMIALQPLTVGAQPQ